MLDQPITQYRQTIDIVVLYNFSVYLSIYLWKIHTKVRSAGNPFKKNKQWTQILGKRASFRKGTWKFPKPVPRRPTLMISCYLLLKCENDQAVLWEEKRIQLSILSTESINFIRLDLALTNSSQLSSSDFDIFKFSEMKMSCMYSVHCKTLFNETAIVYPRDMSLVEIFKILRNISWKR